MNLPDCKCAFCGSPHTVKETALEKLLDGKPVMFGGREVTIPRARAREALRVMVRKGGRVTRKQEIINAVYGDRPDGGPETAQKVIDLYIHSIRKTLCPDAVLTVWGQGWYVDLDVLSEGLGR